MIHSSNVRTSQFLMPGMADMHVHFMRSALLAQPQRTSSKAASVRVPASASPDHERENQALRLLFVANGVTAVRNMWGGPSIDSFARQIRLRRAAGPHIYSTGPITDGSPPMWEGAREIQTQSQAEAAVRRDKEVMSR